jgi:hypothetical protein
VRQNINLVHSDIHHHHLDLVPMVIFHLRVSPSCRYRKKQNRGGATSRETPHNLTLIYSLPALALLKVVLQREPEQEARRDGPTLRRSDMEYKGELVRERLRLFQLVQQSILLQGEESMMWQLPKEQREKAPKGKCDLSNTKTRGLLCTSSLNSPSVFADRQGSTSTI